MDSIVKDHPDKTKLAEEKDSCIDFKSTAIVCNVNVGNNNRSEGEGTVITGPESLEVLKNKIIEEHQVFSDNENSMEQDVSIDASTVDDKEYVDIEGEGNNMEKANCQTSEAVKCIQLSDKNNMSSLSVIAMEYGDSDSETDSSNPKHNIEQNDEDNSVKHQAYRSLTGELLSSSSDSESTNDSSDSSSVSSESELSEDANSDASTNKEKRGESKQPRKSKMKCEWDDLPPIEELKISVPEVLCDPLGEVAWMVEQLVIVKPKLNKPTLNLDTVLFVDRGRKTLGKIFDVFGTVSDPHYSVRFNSTDHIKEHDVQVGMTVYYCPNTEYTSLVFLHELTKYKGTDANADGEPPDFSDDEEERLYYENLKKKQSKAKDDSHLPHKKARNSNLTPAWQSNHPWNRNKQKKDGLIAKQNKQHAPSREGYPAYNAWSPPYAYQNCWPHVPYGFREPHGVQQMSYPNPNVRNIGQTSEDSQNYNTENGTMIPPMTPRPPFIPNARFSSNFPPFNRSRPTPPAESGDRRFRHHPDMSWQSQLPMRMTTSWTYLSRFFPPPPPPPPPPPSDNS